MQRSTILLVALLAACDEDNPARHLDGGTADSPTVMIDAPQASDPVTLTVTYNGQPQAGVVVHFQNSDSTLVATEMTDATGVASHVMAAGGYVTAVDPFPVLDAGSHFVLRTFAGVKPGDQLKLTSGLGAGSIEMTVTLPVQPDTQTTRYSVNSGCTSSPSDFFSSGSGFQPTGSIFFSSTCTTTDILATSYNANGDLLAYMYVPGQAITANGTLDYTSKSFSSPTSRTYTFNNKPGTMSSLGVEQHIGNATGELVDVTASATGSPDVATLGLPTVSNAIGLLQVDARDGMSYHTLFDWGPLTTTAYSTDVGARKLVGISAAAYDAASHSLTWTEGSGAVPQYDYIELYGNRTASTTNFSVAWNMVAPHVAGSAQFPVLPVGDVDLNFDADDNIMIYGLNLMKSPGGYDAVRANGFSLENIVSLGNEFQLAASGSGTAEVVRYSPLVPERKAPPSALGHRAKR